MYCLGILSLASCNKNPARHEGYVRSGDARIYYCMAGKGEPILLINGGPGMEHTCLMPQMEQLSEHHRVIFYDQRGVGKSEAPITPESITLDNYIDDIEALRKELKIDKINLLGHSFGGQLAMLYGIRYPENLKSMVLVCPASASSDFYKPFSEKYERKITVANRNTLMKILESTDFQQRKPVAFQEYYRVYFRPYFFRQDDAARMNMQVTEMTAMNSDSVTDLLSPYLSEYDFHADLSKIHCPTLIIAGDSDLIPLEFMERIRKEIGGSELVIFKDCGHFPFIEVPGAFFDTVEKFLDRL